MENISVILFVGGAMKKDKNFTNEFSRSSSSSNLPIGPGIGVRQIRKQSLLNSQNLSHSSSSGSSEREAARLQGFQKLLSCPNIDLSKFLLVMMIVNLFR